MSALQEFMQHLLSESNTQPKQQEQQQQQRNDSASTLTRGEQEMDMGLSLDHLILDDADENDDAIQRSSSNSINDSPVSTSASVPIIISDNAKSISSSKIFRRQQLRQLWRSTRRLSMPCARSLDVSDEMGFDPLERSISDLLPYSMRRKLNEKARSRWESFPSSSRRLTRSRSNENHGLQTNGHGSVRPPVRRPSFDAVDDMLIMPTRTWMREPCPAMSSPPASTTVPTTAPTSTKTPASSSPQSSPSQSSSSARRRSTMSIPAIVAGPSCLSISAIRGTEPSPMRLSSFSQPKSKTPKCLRRLRYKN